MLLRERLKEDWIFVLCFFVLIFLIYGQSLSGNFVFDDRNLVEHQELLSNLQNMGQVIMYPFWNTESGLYRPITLLSYMFNFIFLGADPAGFHFINLVSYFLICTLIYLFIKRLFKEKKLALVTTLLFLLLPIHTEVVANISGRGELLALFFSLLTLYELANARINEKETKGTGEVNFWRVGFWMLLAIGSKETAITVIPLALIVIYIKEKRLNLEMAKKYFRSMSAILLAAIFYFFVRFFALGPKNFFRVQTSLIENPLMFSDAWSRVITSLKILWMYFVKTFWPVNLCSDYSYNQIPVVNNFFNPGTILGLLLLLFAIALIFVYRNKKPVISLASAIFIFSFLPVSNIFFPIGTIAGERLFFFPTLGLCLGSVFILTRLFDFSLSKGVKVALLFLVVVWLGVYGVASFKRQGVWLDEKNLFLSGAVCAPESVLSRSNSGAIYLLHGNLEKAREELELARKIKPIYSKGLNNLGLVYFKMGENEKAEELYREALKQDFPYSGTYENLILLYLNEGKIDQARRWLLFLYPGNQKLVDALIKNYLKK